GGGGVAGYGPQSHRERDRGAAGDEPRQVDHRLPEVEGARGPGEADRPVVWAEDREGAVLEAEGDAEGEQELARLGRPPVRRDHAALEGHPDREEPGAHA